MISPLPDAPESAAPRRSWLRDPALWVVPALVVLVAGLWAALVFAPIRNPAGSAFPAGLPIAIACLLAGLWLSVGALRRRRSWVIITAAVLNFLVAAYTMLLLIAALTGPEFRF